MQSQIQCPVCTLYLHVGMNLQVHLDTHPKDQVITALVNFTLLQQSNNSSGEADDSRFECTAYEPLSAQETGQYVEPLADQPVNSVVYPEGYSIQQINDPLYSAVQRDKSPTNLPYTTTIKSLNRFHDLPPPPSYDEASNSALRSQRSVLQQKLEQNRPIATVTTINGSTTAFIPNTPSASTINTKVNAMTTPVEPPTIEFKTLSNHRDDDDNQNIGPNRPNIVLNVSELNRPTSVIQINNTVPEKRIVSYAATPIIIQQQHQQSQIIHSSYRPIIQKKSGLRILSDVTLNPNENLLMSDLNHRVYDTITLTDVFLSHNPTTDTSSTGSMVAAVTTLAETETTKTNEVPPLNTANCGANNQLENDDQSNELEDEFNLIETVLECDGKLLENDHITDVNVMKEDPLNKEQESSASIDINMEPNDDLIDVKDDINQNIAEETNASESANKPISVICRTTPIKMPLPIVEQFVQLPTRLSPPLPTPRTSKSYQMQPQTTIPFQSTKPITESTRTTKRPLLKKPFVKTPKRIVVKFKKPIVTTIAAPIEHNEPGIFQPNINDDNHNNFDDDDEAYNDETAAQPVEIKSEPAIDIPCEERTDSHEKNLCSMQGHNDDEEEDVVEEQQRQEEQQKQQPEQVERQQQQQQESLQQLHEDDVKIDDDIAFSPLRESFTPTPQQINDDLPNIFSTENNEKTEPKIEDDNMATSSATTTNQMTETTGTSNTSQTCGIGISNSPINCVTESIEYSIKIMENDNTNNFAELNKKTDDSQNPLIADNQNVIVPQQSWIQQAFTEQKPSDKIDHQIYDAERKPDDYFLENTMATATVTATITSTTIAISTTTIPTTATTVATNSFSMIVETATSPQPQTSLSSSLHTEYNAPGPSRDDYGLTSFFGYTDPTDGDDFYSSVPLSPIGYSPDNYLWNQKYSPSYNPFDGEKNSYVDLDLCKNTTNSNCERAPSADSLNIRTDEKMPAKGEISEQESNGDIEGSWSHQIFPLQDALPKYTSSYDTTVARESWSLSNEKNLLQQNLGQLSTVLPIFTPLRPAVENDVKPDIVKLQDNIGKTKLQKSRRYRCPECPQIFSILKDKRNHLVDVHNYQQPCRRSKATATATNASTSNINTISNGSSSSTIAVPSSFLGVKIKPETNNVLERIKNMNQHLLNANWAVLRQKLTDEDVKIPILPAENNVYMCMVCHERFYSIKTFNAHYSVHPAECYTCGRLFKHWVNFSVHLKRHFNIKEFGCIHCTKRFVLRQNLIEHLNTHSGDTPFHCKLCSKRFRRYSNLVQHRNRHHLNIRPKEKDYICQCGDVFHSLAKFAWHKETHDKKPKCCPYCRERFMHRNSLSRHVRLSHTEHFPTFNADLVECPICFKKYIKSSLKNHLSMHSTKIVYECNICNKRFTTKWNLKQHKWIHASRSLKPYKCGMCPKAFIRESEYTSHVNTHKSIKPFTCDHCGCQFARKYNWLRHAREHEHPKKHRCDECGKDFHRAYYLTEHKRSHTGERPFECVICGKTSTTKTNHNKHVKIHHARDPLTAEG